MSNTLIPVTLDKGPALPMRPYPTRHGNTAFAVLATRADGSRYYSPKGVFVPRSAFPKALPASVEVLGQKVELTKDTNTKGKDRVSGTATVTVPGHGQKQFRFRMTITDDARVNIDASIHGSGGASTALEDL